MRAMGMIAASVVFAVALNIPSVSSSLERLYHHGQLVENSSDPSYCITCHDGLIAPNAHFCTVECGFRNSHSILKDYPPRFKEDAYAPVESLLDKGIRLYKGKVSCVSCHDLNQPARYHLIFSDTPGTLCTTCHLK